MRGSRTLDMLKLLRADKWIGTEAVDDLTQAYTYLRRVEHRLQMVSDEQTHTLPSDPERLAHFARFLGFSSRQAFAETFLGHLRAVQRQYAGLFEGEPVLAGIEQPLHGVRADEAGSARDQDLHSRPSTTAAGNTCLMSYSTC